MTTLEDVLAAHRRGDWSDRTYTCQGCSERVLAEVDGDDSVSVPEARRRYAAVSKPGWSFDDYNAHLAAAIRAHLLSEAVVDRAGEGVEDGLSDSHSGKRDIALLVMLAATQDAR